MRLAQIADVGQPARLPVVLLQNVLLSHLRQWDTLCRRAVYL
jgi:hypothetical protein